MCAHGKEEEEQGHFDSPPLWLHTDSTCILLDTPNTCVWKWQVACLRNGHYCVRSLNLFTTTGRLGPTGTERFGSSPRKVLVGPAPAVSQLVESSQCLSRQVLFVLSCSSFPTHWHGLAPQPILTRWRTSQAHRNTP